MKYQSPMIKRINQEKLENKTSDCGEKIFKQGALIFSLVTALYFSQGVLKSLGKAENQQMAREMRVPTIEQSYVDYLCLGAKNLAEKIYSTLK